MNRQKASLLGGGGSPGGKGGGQSGMVRGNADLLPHRYQSQRVRA